MPDNQTGGEQTQGQPSGTTPDWTKLVDENGKILGKWDRPEEVRDGYFNLANQRAEIERERDFYKQASEELMKRVNPLPTPERPEDRLEKMGVPANDLVELVRREAQEIARKQFEPLTKTLEARNKVVTRFPEYSTRESEIMGTVSRNPDLSARFNRLAAHDPEAALDFAIAEWRLSSPNARQSQTQTPEAQAARSAATLPSAQQGGAGGRPAGPDDQKLANAIRYGHMTGSPEALLETIFEGSPLSWTEQMAAQLANRGQ
jgi:hypothetical protein